MIDVYVIDGHVFPKLKGQFSIRKKCACAAKIEFIYLSGALIKQSRLETY